MEPSQSKIITIPTRYNASERERIGEEVVRFIKRRTSDGLDVNGRPFAGYRKSYEKTGTVNLRLTGDMMSDLEFLSHGPGFIKIGFTSSTTNDKAGWIQNPRGQKSGKQPQREFVGISQSDLNIILERI